MDWTDRDRLMLEDEILLLENFRTMTLEARRVLLTVSTNYAQEFPAKKALVLKLVGRSD